MSANLEEIAVFSKQLKEAREALQSERKVLHSLEMKNGQDFSTNVTVCGKRFALVVMGGNYGPERVKELDVVRLELIKYQQGIVQYHIGAVEGLEFKLVQAARGVSA